MGRKRQRPNGDGVGGGYRKCQCKDKRYCQCEQWGDVT